MAAATQSRRVSWRSLMRTARVPFGLLALVGLALVGPDQMQDMLAALSEPPHRAGATGFCVTLGLLALSCWYWARASIAGRFDLPDARGVWALASGVGGRPPIDPVALRRVPQLPFPMAMLIAAGLGWRSQAWGLAACAAATLAMLWLLVSERRRLRDALRTRLGRAAVPLAIGSWDERLHSTARLAEWPGCAAYRWQTLLRRAPGPAGGARLWVVGSLALFVACFVGSIWGHDIRWVQYALWTMYTGPTPVFVGGALIMAPLTALTFLADSYRPRLLHEWLGLPRPPVLFGCAVAVALLARAAPLHDVRRVAGEPDDRPTLAEQWRGWQSACGGHTRPVIVAISGGASRAGLWGASVLEQVDQTAAANGRAAVFAISSVSGGSLGAAAYMAARAGQHAGCRLDPALQGKFGRFAEAVGAADEIGPLLAGAVLSDLPRALLGWLPALFGADLAGGDRAAAIERAFEANAREAAIGGFGEASTPADFATGYMELTKNRFELPLWIANGTERDTGARALTIAIRGKPEPQALIGRRVAADTWPFLGASDTLGQLHSDVAISTAINDTARFPYLEPGGIVSSDKPGSGATGLLDGGYFDNSGLQTAIDLAEWIEREDPDAHPIIIAATGDGDGDGATVIAPAAERAAKISEIQPDRVVRCDAQAFDPLAQRPPKATSELLTPLLGLINVRSGHVDILLRRAANRYCTNGPLATKPDLPQSFFHYYLPACGRQNVPLDWVLSDAMAHFVWSAIGRSLPVQPPGLCDLRGNEFVTANRRQTEALCRSLGGACDAERVAELRR